LSIIAKVLDSLVADDLFLRFKSIISEKQHGFFRGRSTTTNLLSYTERIQRCLNTGGQIDVVYTDFSKAFDKVVHDVLLEKLYSHGVVGSMHNWFKSYLKGRKQRVQIGDSLSHPVDVTSSVVQGSHLGPMLFSIFINDIASYLNVDFNCFADDLKLFVEVDSADDCSKLQCGIDRLTEFCSNNGLLLNAEKCCVVSFTCRKSRFVKYDYAVNNYTLGRRENIRDLGVTYDSKCTFNTHIDVVRKKTKRVLGFIYRNSRDFTNPRTIVALYSQLVRSNLEYASHIWASEHNKQQIKKIEAVQHKFLIYMARRFYKEKGYQIDYEHYEKLLRLDGLELRRVVSDICFVKKSFSGKVDSSSFVHLFRFHIPPRGTRFKQLFSPVGLYSVFDRLMRSFNKFCNDSDELFESSGLESLKKKVGLAFKTHDRQ
jgi:hypothetical protein